MKRTLLAVTLLAVVLVGAGGAWYKFGRGHDPLAAGEAALAKGDLQTAQIELRNAVRQSPKSAEANFRLGTLQLQMGDPVAAERQLKAARDLGQDPRTVRLSIAQSYLGQGKYKELLDEFQPEGQPAQAASILVLRGMAQLGLDDRAAAKESLAEAERMAPQLADAPLGAARVALADRDYRTAEAKVDRTLQIDPKRADALLMKGQLLSYRGDRTGAVTALDGAVEASGGSLAARLERANVLLASGQNDKAKADIDAALKAQPRSPAALYLQAMLLSRTGDYAGADQALMQIQPMLGRFPRGYIVEAVVKFNLGQIELAADAAERQVARAPDDLDSLKLLARIDIAAGRGEKAREVLSRSISSGRADAEVLDLVGQAYAKSGQAAQAVDSFQRAADMAPGNADILTRLASSKLQLGDAAGATGALERSLQISPDQTAAAESLVVAALTAGDIDRAKAALDRLRTQVGETEAVGNLTGMLRMAQLDPNGARDQFAAVVKAFPKSTAARMNLVRLLIQQGRIADAERTLTEALAAEPANEQVLAGLVGLYIQDNRMGRAVATMEAAHTAAPTNVALTAVLADLYVRSGEPKKALTLLDDAIRGQSPPPALLGARARAQAAAGDKAAAKETYRGILVANPADYDARARLMDLYVEDKEIEPARALLRDGLKVSPGNIGMLQSVVAIEQRSGGIDAGLAAADKLAADPANMPVAAWLRGDVYMSNRRFGDAAAAYAAAARTTPSTALTIRTATAFNASGAPDKAADVLRAWLKQHPDDADVAQVLAGLDIAAKRYKTAEEALHAVLAKRPNDAVALNNLAWVLQIKGDGGARAMAQRAYLLAPSPETADTLGWIMTETGAAKDATALLRQASVARPSNLSIQYHLAQALNATGQADEAAQVLAGIVDASTPFDEQDAARALLQQIKSRR